MNDYDNVVACYEKLLRTIENEKTTIIESLRGEICDAYIEVLEEEMEMLKKQLRSWYNN